VPRNKERRTKNRDLATEIDTERAKIAELQKRIRQGIKERDERNRTRRLDSNA
jgi:hypothetical protein